MESFDSEDLSGSHGYMSFDSFRYPEENSPFGAHSEESGANGFAHGEGDDSPLPPPPSYAQRGAFADDDNDDDDDGISRLDLNPPPASLSHHSSSAFDQPPSPSLSPPHPNTHLPPVFAPESNGIGSRGFGDQTDIFGGSDDPHDSLNGGGGGGPLLPPPEELQREDGFVLREWRRQNAIRLAEKENLEKEKLAEIIETAERFKQEFYGKRVTHCEASKKNNREKEKVFLANQETFHKNADKHYWKAVAELVPNELPTMEVKSRGKDKDKKKTSLIANQGPKPGKATDLSRMRQILVKLKHNPPEHMKAPPTPPPTTASKEKPGSQSKPAPASASASASTPAPPPHHHHPHPCTHPCTHPPICFYVMNPRQYGLSELAVFLFCCMIYHF